MICEKCGYKNTDKAKICASCGHVLEANVNNNKTDNDDIQKNKAMAALCYLGIFILIPYFRVKDSNYVNFHIKQGINLLIVDFVLGFISGLVEVLNSLDEFGSLDYAFFTIFLASILAIMSMGVLVITFKGVLNAVNGKMEKLPIIGNLNIIK